MIRYIVFALAAVICAGCAPQSVVLDQRYQNDAASGFNADAKCQYVITDIRDNRKDKQSLGNLGYTEVSSEDVIQWLRNGLAASGFEAVAARPDGRRTVPISLELKLAYVKSSSTSMATNLVVGISFCDKSETSYLRGNNCQINWSSSQEGVKASFDEALKKVLAQLIEFSGAHCSECVTEIEENRL